MDIQTATPREIDTVLAGIYARFGQAQAAVMTHRQHAARYNDGLAKKESGDFRYGSYTAEHAAELDRVADVAEVAARAILAEAAPYEAEYTRRGGWTRAFLVDNTGGHVHRSTACATCFPTTEFVWLPQYSGDSEERIVDDAGKMACTICYPSAPVDVLSRASRIEAPARRAAREEREAKAAAKAAKTAAAAIANPDGTPLRGKYGVLKTERAAWIELVDIVLYHRAFNYPEHAEIVDAIAAALAARQGVGTNAIVVEMDKKVAAKAKRENIAL